MTPIIFHTPHALSPERCKLTRAIFLDRDGVINEDHGYIDSLDRLDIFPHTQLLKSLQDSFRLIIITNQSGIARGKLTEATLELITNHMVAELAEKGVFLDAVYACPHHPTSGIPPYCGICNCRKPQPGLITKAAEDFNISLADSYMIGDKPRDVAAGAIAGTRTILFGQHDHEETRPDFRSPDFTQVVTWIQAQAD